MTLNSLFLCETGYIQIIKSNLCIVPFGTSFRHPSAGTFQSIREFFQLSFLFVDFCRSDTAFCSLIFSSRVMLSTELADTNLKQHSNPPLSAFVVTTRVEASRGNDVFTVRLCLPAPENPTYQECALVHRSVHHPMVPYRELRMVGEIVSNPVGPTGQRRDNEATRNDRRSRI